MISSHTLENGLKIATYQLPDLKSVHLSVLVKGGSIVESKDNNGVAHFMEHMLVQGIPMLPNVEKFASFIEGVAGSYSAQTSNFLVSFDIMVPFLYIEDAIKIASEVFFEPLFVKEAIEKERRAVIEEIQQRMDSHWFTIAQYTKKVRFAKNHPLTMYTGGSIPVVETLTRDDLVEYWQNYFLPENTYVVVTGSFEKAAMYAYIEKYFGKYKNTKRFSGYPTMSASDFTQRQVAIRQDKKLNTCYVDFMFPSVALDISLENLRLRQEHNLAMTILGKLRNSRLFKLLRYQKGLVYDVSVGSSSLPGIGYSYVVCEVTPPNLEEVLDLIVKELREFVDVGPSEEELLFAKNYLTNQWLMAFDHPSSIGDWIEGDLLWQDKIRLPEEYAQLIANISVKDLTNLMHEHWDFSKLNLIIQGPLPVTVAAKQKYSKLIDALQ